MYVQDIFRKLFFLLCYLAIIFNCVIFQERAGVKMILIQDASQGPNVDKPLRIIGDPYKVQVQN